MLAEELDNYLSAFLVALDDNGKVAGYAGLQAVLDEGYITNVAVRAGLAGSRALPESCCKCFLTLLRPTIWHF